MNYNKTYWFSGISVEDAGRVEDPTLCVRPCKSPVGISVEDAGRVEDPTSMLRPCKNPVGISVEDAGRVEDPTSMLRPCKSPVGDRSLVLAESNAKCLDEELLYYQSVLPKSDVF